jgi:hypothetical protein
LASTSSTPSTSQFDDEVEAYLASKDDNSDRTLERNMFISQLTLYDENQQRLPRDSNILEFWSLSPFTQLSQVANILLATPATQVSVERLFSIVKLVFSPLRARIGGNLLADIIFLKANQVNFAK